MPAGYSGTPLPRKLGLDADHVVTAIGAPDDLEQLLQPIPDGLVLTNRLRKHVDVVLLFATRRSRLQDRLSPAAEAIFPDGSIWAAWPKRASKVPTDITEDTVRELALPLGLVDNKVCAIDDTWSGLRVVWRRENRARDRH